jgi:hypothetical protein
MIRDRFKRQLPLCRVFTASQTTNPPPGIDVSQMMNYLDSLKKYFWRYNCTIVEDYFDGLGLSTQNGTYNGVLGKLQRHEADTSFMFYRPDSLVGEPVLIGPTVVAADVVILSQQRNSSISNRRVTSFVNQFDDFMYAYISIIIIIGSVVFTLTKRELYTIKRSQKIGKIIYTSFIKQWFQNLAQMHLSLIDQNYLESDGFSSRIFLTSFYGFVFLLIHAVYLNNIGADLVIMDKPNRVQSLDDLLAGSNEYRPVIMRELLLLPTLKDESKYRPNSDLAKFYAIILEDENASILDMNLEEKQLSDSMKKIWQMIDKIQRSQSALIFPAFIYQAFRIFSCSLPMLTPKTGRILRSRETLAHGHVSSLLSHEVLPESRRVIEYFFRVILEAGFMQMIIGLNRAVALGLNGGMVEAKFGLKALMCEEGVLEDMELEENFRSFTMKDFAYLFGCWLAGLCSALLLVFLESRWRRFSQSLSRNRRRKKHCDVRSMTV